ncbi:signal peptide peptidase SppA [Candidatus Bipolaricaulota bacterium]|nr:signal peptide peptidase SppA [Candidatus Bipolaricaulota bacterium]
MRRLGRAPDYVVFTIEGPIPETAPPRPSFPRRMFSPKTRTLRDLGVQFRRVSRDPRVKGIVLRLYGVNALPAQLQSLRDLIGKLRAAGKRVVVWSHNYDMANYYVANAADEILLQHGGSVAAFGHESRYYFLADALERVGIKGDFVQITPYKTAPDMLMRTSMSEQAREMAIWLLDDLYRQTLEGVANGRSISVDEAKVLIDGCPYSSEKAHEMSAVDEVLGEEALPAYLGTQSKPARLAPYKSAKTRLLLTPLARPGKCVAVLRIAGDIIDGRSSTPPFKAPFRVPLLFSEKAGDLTVVHQARGLARNKRVSAVVVHVDSGGGSATSSEAMAAALKTIAEKKPLIISMGTMAASGGYYVATPGAKIIAQPGTVTGSIGVLSGKLVTAGLFEKILFHREIVSCGKHAGYYSGAQSFTEDERQSLWDSISQIYEQFLNRVSDSRDMTRDEVDAVAGGRVWTGSQAKERGLVDELGGLDLAIQRAREAAGLNRHCRILQVKPSKKLLAPSTPTTAGIFEYAMQSIRMFSPGRALFLTTLMPWEGE